MTHRRRLILMRHAKAEPFASTDHDRPLSGRGLSDATQAGAYLAATGMHPDRVVVSTAVRTRMTWEAVATGLGEGAAAAEVSFEELLFHGGTAEALEVLHELPGTTGTVLLVGHNPTVSDLCHLLDDGTGDAEALGGIMRGFATSALAVFELTVGWSELGAETGRVVGFHAGRS